MKPLYKITADGSDITTAIATRFLSLRMTDDRGMTADQLDIVLEDHDEKLNFPRRGATLSVQIGIEDGVNPENTRLIDKGKFVVDEIEHAGTPDTLTIRARSADFREGLKTQQTISWHENTVGDIVNTIAGKYSLKAVVDAKLASTLIEHIDQTDESDAHFMTRLALRFDAIATVKTGFLLFSRAGEGKTASGVTLPTITIKRNEGDSHSYRESDRSGRYTGVAANWRDHAKAKTQRVGVGAEGYMRTLRATFPTPEAATEAADAEWRRIQRGAVTANVSCSIGRAEIIAESPIVLDGYHPDIDVQKWLSRRVEHSIDSGGYQCRLELEKRI